MQRNNSMVKENTVPVEGLRKSISLSGKKNLFEKPNLPPHKHPDYNEGEAPQRSDSPDNRASIDRNSKEEDKAEDTDLVDDECRLSIDVINFGMPKTEEIVADS
jgi:hypothetical protein